MENRSLRKCFIEFVILRTLYLIVVEKNNLPTKKVAMTTTKYE